MSKFVFLILFYQVLFSSNIFAHGGHSVFIEISEKFVLKNKAKKMVSFKIIFEAKSEKQKAMKKISTIRGRIRNVFKEACYEINSDRGKALLRTDLYHNLTLIGLNLHDVLLKDEIN